MLKKAKIKTSDSITSVIENPLTSQVLSYISDVRYRGAKTRYAALPRTMVTSNWLKLPTMVSKIALSGSVLFSMKTLPKNSPTLLGVKTLTASPANTAT